MVDAIKEKRQRRALRCAPTSERSTTSNAWWTRRQAFGTIDILVNNAGMLNSFKLAEMSVETWDTDDSRCTCAEHVPVHSVRASRYMLKQKSGKIINMSGTFGVTGGAEFTHMSAAKAGMIGFTRALAREVGHEGINVNCIAPAIIRTDLYNFMPEDVRDAIVGAYPLGRVGRGRGRGRDRAVPGHQGRRLFHRADALPGGRRRHG